MFFTIGVLKNFTNFIGNACVGVSINKVTVLKAAALLKRDSNTGVFSLILQNT